MIATTIAVAAGLLLGLQLRLLMKLPAAQEEIVFQEKARPMWITRSLGNTRSNIFVTNEHVHMIDVFTFLNIYSFTRAAERRFTISKIKSACECKFRRSRIGERMNVQFSAQNSLGEELVIYLNLKDPGTFVTLLQADGCRVAPASTVS